MKRLGLLLILVSACGTDEVPNTPDPRQCTAALALSGTFTMSRASPDDVNNDTGDPPGDGRPDINGCWPTGTWAFTASIMSNDCATPPALETYTVRVDFGQNSLMEPEYTYHLVTPDPAVTHNTVKVSSGGGGLCEGNFEIYSPDGKKVWNLHPTLNTFNMSGPLEGMGEYAEFKDSQWDGP